MKMSRSAVLLGVAAALVVVLASPAARAQKPRKQVTIYQLAEVARNARIDHRRVFAATRNLADPRIRLLRTYPGKHRVLTYVAPILGVCKSGPCKVHHVLMLEVDRHFRVVTGYFYVYEWGEGPPPLQWVRAKNLRLTSTTTIGDLKLSRGPAPRAVATSLLDNWYRGRSLYK